MIALYIVQDYPEKMSEQFDLIVISSPTDLAEEINTVVHLFEKGLQYFHLRKPLWEPWQAEEFLRTIPPVFYPRIVLHSNFQLANKFSLGGIHLNEQNKKNFSLFEKYHIVSAAFHVFNEISENTAPYKYVFLSPVFDSISKPGTQSAFNMQELQAGIQDLKFRKENTPKIIALGGINAENIKIVKQHGFSGAAVIGSVWNDAHPLQAFTTLQRGIPI